jgi:phosphoglycerate dehydrogenase-like enzyme
MKVAILDDYQNVALQLADWSRVRRHAEITVFNDHVADVPAIVERLRPFDIVCVMRERTPLTREILQQLPNLRLIASTGPRNASIGARPPPISASPSLPRATMSHRPSSSPGR